MLEHAIGLNLVQGCLKQTLLVQVFIIVICIRAEFLGLLVEELEVGSALVRNIAVDGRLDLFLIPLDLAIPVVFLVIFEIVVKSEVRLLRSIFAFYINS